MLLGIIVLFIHICEDREEHRFIACTLISIAVLLDTIDGKIARILHAESQLGKQLDSFADFISFGLAPVAILLTHSSIRNMGWFMYACVAFYSVAGAFRLARYNIGNYEDFFLGLPITAAGGILIIVNFILHFSPILEQKGASIFIAMLVCILALLMISKVKVYRLGREKELGNKTVADNYNY